MKLLVLPGDGIGPEISAATVDVVTAAAQRAGCDLLFSYADIGFASLQVHGTTFTDDVFAQARDADGVILGPVSHNEYPPSVRKVAGRYPDIEYEEKLVDAVAALLIRDASLFDVIVTTNMFGDILSDEASELSGSLGLAASLNASDKHGAAQAQHGSAPDIANQVLANPASLVGSAAMLLAWLAKRHGDASFERAAAAIEAALDRIVATPQRRTRDLGGTLGKRAFTAALIEEILAG